MLIDFEDSDLVTDYDYIDAVKAARTLRQELADIHERLLAYYSGDSDSTEEDFKQIVDNINNDPARPYLVSLAMAYLSI